MNYTQTTITPNIPWRATPRAASSKRAGRLSKSNVAPVGDGATNYGELKAGTILAEDSNGLLHPLGCAKIANTVSAANAITVDNATHFKVGDLVSVLAGSNASKAVTNNSVVITIVAKVQGLTLDVVVAGNDTPQSVVYTPSTKTITFNSATGGGGAATSTHADIVSELYKLSGLIESASSATPATTVADATHTLGNAKYGAIASARSVTVVAGNVITVDGGALTAAVDDIVIKDGAYKAVGILDETVSTVRYIGTTEVVEDKSVSVAYEGDARDSSTFIHNLCAGNAGAIVKKALGGHVYADPFTPTTEVVPDLVGFRFLDV